MASSFQFKNSKNSKQAIPHKVEIQFRKLSPMSYHKFYPLAISLYSHHLKLTLGREKTQTNRTMIKTALPRRKYKYEKDFFQSPLGMVFKYTIPCLSQALNARKKQADKTH